MKHLFIIYFFSSFLSFGLPQPSDTVAIFLADAMMEVLSNNDLLKRTAARTQLLAVIGIL